MKIAASVDCEKGKSRQKQPHNHKSKALLQSWRHTLEKHSLFEKNSSVVTRWGLHSNREAGQNDSIISEMVLHLFQLYRVSVSMPLVKLFIKYFISKKRVSRDEFIVFVEFLIAIQVPIADLRLFCRRMSSIWIL